MGGHGEGRRKETTDVSHLYYLHHISNKQLSPTHVLLPKVSRGVEYAKFCIRYWAVEEVLLS